MTAWPKGYRRGSTIFKEVLKKNGKLDYYRCVVCGNSPPNWAPNRTFESHEIMHLLQQLRALTSNAEIEPIMQEEDESK